MKKKLLLFALAMVACGFMSIAQTTSVPLNAGDAVVGIGSPNDARPMSANRVDYKGSIFAKTAGDTIYKWNFSSENNASDMPTIYGTNGRVTSGMYVAGEELPVNTCYYDCGTWQYVPDTNWFNGTFFNNNYSTLANGWRAVTQWMIEDLGTHFMLMSLLDYDAYGSNFPNAYMQFASVTCPAGAAVIKVAIKQEYRKYYDQCWIDYKVGNIWNTREINVTGVDLDVNDWGAVNTEYTMPLELATQSNIELRIRYSGTTRNVISVHGYFWAIGEVAIIEGAASSLRYYSDNYMEGGYGIIPQGMQLPLTWYAPVSNDGAIMQTGVNVSMQHTSPAGVSSTLLTQSQANIPAGNSSGFDTMVIDGRNFFNSYQPGWYGYTPTYGNTTINVTNNGLPTTEAGLHSVQATLGTNELSQDYAVHTYTVSTADATGVYTWALDNGVLTSVNGNGGWRLGHTTDGYITDEGNFNEAGYELWLRYTTGNTMPLDVNEDPWVMRGIEMVVDPSVAADAVGANITPILVKITYNDDGDQLFFNNISTGVIDHTVLGTEVTQLSTGYLMPGQYNTVRITFPEQPELEPNTSYFIGYRLNNYADFALATSRNRFVIQDENGNLSYTLFNDDSTLTAYSNFFSTNYFDILVLDPVSNYGRFWGSMYNNSIPMIRPLVGPRIELPSFEVSVTCNNASVYYNNNNVCGETVSVTEGGYYLMYIYPEEGGQITQIAVDGVALNLDADEWDNDYDEHLVRFSDLVDQYDDDGNYIGYYERTYYSYTFENITTNHTISVTGATSCSQPSVSVWNVNHNSAHVQWSGLSTSTYEVEYGPAGFTHGNGTTISVYYSTDITLTGLNAETEYDVYVRVVCSDTSYSDWSSVYTFTTTAMPNMITLVNHGGGYLYCYSYFDGYDFLVGIDSTLVESHTSGVSVQPATLDPNYWSEFGFPADAYRVLRIVVDGSEYNLQGDSRFEAIYDYLSSDGYIIYSLFFSDGLPHTVDVYYGSFYPTVTTEVNDDALGFVLGGGSYSPGNAVTLTAVAYTGATFTGWNSGSTANPLYFTMVGDTTITAYFATATGGLTHDTVTVQVPVHDTTFVTVHDTTEVVVTVYDTTFVPVHDTTIIYSDTIFIEVHDTLFLHDTIVIHDTIYITDTIENGVERVVSNVKLYGENGQVVVEGSEGATVVLYDAVGRMLATRRDNVGRLTFDVPASGMYLVKIGEHPARRIVVIR